MKSPLIMILNLILILSRFLAAVKLPQLLA
jgi:hypothetical protein